MKSQILFIAYLLIGTALYAQTLQEVQQKKQNHKTRCFINSGKPTKHQPSNVKAGGYGEVLSSKEKMANTICSYPAFLSLFLSIRDGW